MGRLPQGGGPAFRFTPNEVMEMESCLQEISKFNYSVPPRETICAFAEKFSASKDRAGKVVVQPKQVLNWFQNRRYAHRTKVKEPAKLSISPVSRDDAAQFRNVAPPVSVPQGRSPLENVEVEFEAKSAKDGACSYSMEKTTQKFESKSKRSYIHWTVEMDTTLSNVLLEQHNLGHKTTYGWKSVAFIAAISALKDTCNVDINKEKIMARLKTWNKYYQDVSAMLDTSGFGWDWEQNVVKVDSEEIWTNYVKAHPSVNHYRGKIIINWADLAILCGKDKATGSHAATATETINELEAEFIGEESQTPRDCSRVDNEGSTRMRKKRDVGIDALAEAISTVAASMDRALGVNITTDAQQLVAHAQVIYASLARLPELDQREILKAMDMLTYDNTKYGIFMALPDDMKTTWLQMQFYD